MGKIFIMLVIMPFVAYADAPTTSCPNGYISIEESHMTVATTCPSNTASAGTATSCLASNPNGVMHYVRTSGRFIHRYTWNF